MKDKSKYARCCFSKASDGTEVAELCLFLDSLRFQPGWAQRGYSWQTSRSQCHGPQKRAPQTSSCSREVCAMQSRDCTSISKAFLDALDEQLEGIVKELGQPDS